jgi:hypothetical protein
MSEAPLNDPLAEAVREVVLQTQGTAPRPALKASNRRGGLLALALGWVFLAWIWIARPAWIFGARPPQLTAAQAEHEARFALFLTRERMEAFRAESGQLPTSLAELPHRETGVRLLPGEGSYDLAIEVNGRTLIMHSTMNADSFLGNPLNSMHQARQ